MVAQTLHIIDRLLADICKECLVSRICGAGKHEVLPYEDTVAVAEIIEIIILIHAASPYTDHIHIHRFCIEHMLVVFLMGNARKEIIERNHIHTLHEHRFAVEFESERTSLCIILCDELERSDTDCIALCHFILSGLHCGVEIIKIGLSETVSPP